MRSRNMFSEEFYKSNGGKETPELDPTSPPVSDPIVETPVAETIEPEQSTTAPVTLIEETNNITPTIRPIEPYYQTVNIYQDPTPETIILSPSDFSPSDTGQGTFWSGNGVAGGGAIDDKSLDEITDDPNGSPTKDKKRRVLWMVLVGVALVVAYKYYRKNN